MHLCGIRKPGMRNKRTRSGKTECTIKMETNTTKKSSIAILQNGKSLSFGFFVPRQMRKAGWYKVKTH
jgi:hypothetical protein